MPKRKSSADEEPSREAPRRSARRHAPTGSSARAPPSATAIASKVDQATATRTLKPKTKKTPGQTATVSGPANDLVPPAKNAKATKVAVTGSESPPEPGGAPPGSARQYWLMKAEPESRLENGIDVAFSIDHLAAKTAPEPWDGIRAYAARNNLRAMKKGDLAFFYHSNCKEPGIVGTMEIVEEHSPDLSAHDPRAPYYDAKSKPEDPRWSVVHVTFRSKLGVPVTLKALRAMGGAGKPLENMQMLKQTRLSVSRVSAAEWGHIMAAGSVPDHEL